MLDYLEANVRADPQGLGDAHRESPEELAERHERVRGASLAALAQLLDRLLPDQAAAAAGAAPGALLRAASLPAA